MGAAWSPWERLQGSSRGAQRGSGGVHVNKDLRTPADKKGLLPGDHRPCRQGSTNLQNCIRGPKEIPQIGAAPSWRRFCSVLGYRRPILPSGWAAIVVSGQGKYRFGHRQGFAKRMLCPWCSFEE